MPPFAAVGSPDWPFSAGYGAPGGGTYGHRGGPLFGPGFGTAQLPPGFPPALAGSIAGLQAPPPLMGAPASESELPAFGHPPRAQPGGEPTGFGATLLKRKRKPI
jgi:hypothetical protein